jgi:NhaP-type Na+/H+ or K+/H+ antiporter
LVWEARAGIAIGLALSAVLYLVHRSSAHNALVYIILILIMPCVACLLTEEVHVSSVLAVVTAALFLSCHAARLFGPEGRLQVYAVRNTVMFMLNGIVFILIGLQLPTLLAGLSDTLHWALVAYAGLMSLVVIVSRLLWVLPATYLPRWLSYRIRAVPRPLLTTVTVIA